MLKRMMILCGLTAGAVAAGPALAGDVLMYAENDCRGPVAFRYPAGRVFKESCKSSRAVCRGKNDEARSLKVTGTTRPMEIRLYDDPGGAESDDYSIIQFRNYRPEYRDQCVPTFERSTMGFTQGQVIAKRRNGLDGKVSYVVVYPR